MCFHNAQIRKYLSLKQTLLSHIVIAGQFGYCELG